MRRNQWFVLAFAVVGLSCSVLGFGSVQPAHDITPHPAPDFPGHNLDGSYPASGEIGIMEIEGVRYPSLLVYPNEHQKCLCMVVVDDRNVVCRCRGKVPRWGECREAASTPGMWDPVDGEHG